MKIVFSEMMLFSNVFFFHNTTMNKKFFLQIKDVKGRE